MGWKWKLGLFALCLTPQAFSQNLEFRADRITVTEAQLQTAKCVQVGLYVRSTAPEETNWAQITATLSYTELGNFIEGTPFAKVSNFSDSSDGGIADPGVGIANGSGASTSCSPMNIINVATSGQGGAIDLATGSSPASILVEQVNNQTGRIDVSALNFTTNNITLAPNVEYLFAIIEFPLVSSMDRSDTGLRGGSGIEINFFSNSQVPDGNIVTDGVNTQTASTTNGSIQVGDGSNAADQVGLFRPSSNAFFLDVDGSRTITFGGSDRVFGIGAQGDTPFIGNWDGGNNDHVGLRRTNTFSRFFLDVNGNDAIGAGDRNFFMGATTDIAIKGDWNGDGTDEVGLFRPSNNQFFLDADNSGSITGTDPSFFMGASGDLPVIGDWNGDGTDEVGLYRPSTSVFYLDVTGNRAIGAGDAIFGMGSSGDIPLVGDWNGNGTDNVGIFRPSSNVFFLDVNGNNSIGAGDAIFGMGASGDLPIIGKW